MRKNQTDDFSALLLEGMNFIGISRRNALMELKNIDVHIIATENHRDLSPY
jgi:hypothetical protein